MFAIGHLGKKGREQLPRSRQLAADAVATACGPGGISATVYYGEPWAAGSAWIDANHDALDAAELSAAS